MRQPHLKTGLVAALIGAAALTLSAPAARAGNDGEYAKWMADKGPTLVTLKFVLKVKMGGMMGGGEQEDEAEATGVMIEPDGLILCSNSQLGGFVSLIKRFLPGGSGITANPTDIKVLVGDDTEGVEAKIIARDTELDLAWIHIEEPKIAYKHVDLAKAAEPEIGVRVFSLRRMGKYFDRVLAVSEGRIGGVTKKPRKLYVPAGQLAAMPGAPVFAVDGSLVGLTVMQAPDEEDAAMSPMAMMNMMGDMQGAAQGLILPTAELAKATRRALESVEEEEE